MWLVLGLASIITAVLNIFSLYGILDFSQWYKNVPTNTMLAKTATNTMYSSKTC